MASIKRLFFSGIYYGALSKFFGIIINLIVSGILARLLKPDQFGIVAISMVFISFFSIITDTGIGPAIIQTKSLTNEEITEIFSFTLYVGLFFSITFAFLSYSIANYYDTQVLVLICQILSVSLFFSILNIVPKSLLLKEKKFRFISLRTVLVQIITGIIAIIAALKGLGIYSLLIVPVLTSIFSFWINYLFHPLNFNFRIGLSGLKKIYSFSFYQFLFTFINYFSRNLDNLLVGKYLGLSLLGYYEKSYRLMMLPLSNVSFILTPVMHPILSDFQNDVKKMRSIYLNILKYLSFIGLLLSCFLFFNSKELILLIFGNQWGLSIPIFQLLSLSVGFQIIVASAGSIFQATNNTRLLFIDGTISTFFTVSVILVGVFVFKDLKILAFLISLAYMINFFKSYYILFHWGLKGKVFDFYKLLIIPLFLTFCLAIVLYFLDFITPDNLILSLLIKSSVTLLFVYISTLIFKEYNFIDIIKDGIRKT